jgi:hypothetical protein
MAHLVHKNGLDVWWPDYYKVDNVQLDPALTPMENCWRIIDMQVSVWLNKYRMFAFSEDRMVDLEQMCRVAVYQELVRYVVEKVYNKRYNFWCNVRSCAWSVIPRTIKKWHDQDVIHANELDGNSVVNDDPASHSHETFFDMISTESVPKFRTNAEYTTKITDWRNAVRKCDQQRILNESIEDDYGKYCEDCAELGVEPIDKVTFVLNSYSEEEHELMQYVPEKRTMYNRKYVDKIKSDPARLERKRAYDRAYHARRKAEKDAQKQK